jgi:hypothetical protein
MALLKLSWSRKEDSGKNLETAVLNTVVGASANPQLGAGK